MIPSDWSASTQIAAGAAVGTVVALTWAATVRGHGGAARAVAMLTLAWALGAGSGVTHAAFTSTTSTTGTFGAATTFSCARTRTLVADADTYVNEGSKTSNYGTFSSLYVTWPGPNERTLVHFSLPSAGGCTVSQATLKLYRPSSPPENRVLDASRVSTAWSETAVTWNTQPGTTGSPVAIASTNGWNAWNVTTLVQNMYAGVAGDSSFLVKNQSESGSGTVNRNVFNAREASTNKPQLEVTFVL